MHNFTIVDIVKLKNLANVTFGIEVDCDFRGIAITDIDVLLCGAYSPSIMRIVHLVVATYAGKTPPYVISKSELLDIASLAVGETADYDFGNNQITNYSILFDDEYGYGKQVLQLVNLSLTHHDMLSKVISV